MTQARITLEAALIKLERRVQLSFSEWRVVAVGTNKLTGKVNESEVAGGRERTIKRKVSFSSNRLFDGPRAPSIFDCRSFTESALASITNRTWLLLAFNYARYRFVLARPACRQSCAVADIANAFAEWASWVKSAVRLLERLCECYDALADKQTNIFLSNYSGWGFSYAELIGPARDGVIAGLNTYDTKRIEYKPGDDDVFSGAIESWLKLRIKTEVVSKWIDKGIRQKKKEIVIPRADDEDDWNYFDSFPAATKYPLPAWLAELLEERKGKPLEEAFRRLQIYRGAIEAAEADSPRILRNIEPGKHAAAQSPGADFGTETIPADWHNAWIRLMIHDRLLKREES